MPPEPIVVQNNVRSHSKPPVPLFSVQHGNDRDNRQPKGFPKIPEGSISPASSPALARGDTDVDAVARPLRWMEANDSSTIEQLPNGMYI